MASKDGDVIGYDRLMEMLTSQFPEVVQEFDDSIKGVLHCEMGTFAQLTEEAIDKGNYWQAEKYFRFVDQVRSCAAPDVENAIDVSYIEYLAFSEMSENRYRAMKRMPARLKKVLLEIDGTGRWGRVVG